MLMIIGLFKSAFCRVGETTYFAILFSLCAMFALSGSS
jgi:hypothetical protein